MSYESLSQLVSEVELKARAHQDAQQEALATEALENEKLQQITESAAKLFKAHGGEYQPSAACIEKWRRQNADGSFGLSPWDRTESQPVKLGITGDKEGSAVISAITRIGRQSDTETSRKRGWFGVVRERTREISVPYVSGVCGYSVSIFLGEPAVTDRSQLREITTAHTSQSHVGYDIEKFEELLELIASTTEK